MADSPIKKVPVTILTGFLGSVRQPAPSLSTIVCHMILCCLASPALSPLALPRIRFGATEALAIFLTLISPEFVAELNEFHMAGEDHFDEPHPP
jgi:hypothetical protein